MTSILVIGDSNFRDLTTSHKGEIENEIGEKFTFALASSVASVKTILDNQEVMPDIVFIASPTNEISQKSKNNTKSREGIIESVITDLYNQVTPFATKNERSFFVMIQPFIRYEPGWIETKFKFYLDHLKATHNSTASANICLGSAIELEGDDLKPDKIHLNAEGLKKLKSILVSDVKTAISERLINITGSDQQEEEEMNISPTQTNQTRTLRKTPARRKRPIDDFSDEEGKSRKKKSKDRIDSVLEKLDLLMDKFTSDKTMNNQRFDKIEERLDETVLVQENLKEEVEKIKKSECSFAASVREDLDAVENMNARDTVIVKKLEIESVPNEKKELSNVVLKTGKEIVTLIMGDDKIMKFVTPLYFNNNKRIPKEGERTELPPFKIVFKRMQDAIEFREKAITASKDLSHRLYKAHFSHQQSVGTRVRLSLLWGVADALKKEKKDSWVTQSSPKPTLMVKENGNLVKSFGYIDAMVTYGDKIDPKIKEEATKLATRFFYGQVEKIFIILKD
jgi:hypothetical protein